MSKANGWIVTGLGFVAPLCWAAAWGGFTQAAQVQGASALLQQIGTEHGICAVLGLPEDGKTVSVIRLAQASRLLVYFQSPDAEDVLAVRRAAAGQGLLGLRVFVDQGDWDRIHLADNLASALIVGPAAADKLAESEIQRVLHPEGVAIVGSRRLVKPPPEGIDAWSHPFHGPDNNPQSTDQLARAPYLTQFLAEPYFVPMPEVSVAAGGRVFRAFGHIAHKANQNAWLNTLIGVNGYNGTILWRRQLPEGFMIHRNTMVATPDLLYFGDHESCKRIDARTGRVVDEITIPEGLADGPVWKWMALEDGVLYALIGGPETPIHTQPSRTPGLGHWPWGMWAGHEYADPKTSFGFGRTLVAIDPESKKILWSHREEDYLDGRGVCMGGGRIYAYSPEKFLMAVDTSSGKVAWRTADAELLEAIGPNQKAQNPIAGYATTAYIKCKGDYLFFAGPQRLRLVAVSTSDGRLLWTKESGNYQLVLRDDAIYAVGPQMRGRGVVETGLKLDYRTGKVLGQLPMRRACTRATGSVDSIFYRALGGTVRVDLATNTAKHIDPMRPPCQDGVIIANGMLYWGPWMCGCQLSLYGHIGLGPAGEFDFQPGARAEGLEFQAKDLAVGKPLPVRAGDWPAWCGDSSRSMRGQLAGAARVDEQWTVRIARDVLPTAPVTAGGLVFVADRSGVVRAVDAHGGEIRWEAYTGGAIFFPPAVADGRLVVGSGDGRIYAFEAATGRPLWRFRAAPAERLIPVYGRLLSTWPVAGGVVVQDGVVYAAAGIAHYDGTHVYALDLASGKVLWYNDSSGKTSKVSESGVSLQGSLAIRDGQLQFLGGGVHEVARYDLKTGQCLNEPHDAPNALFPTAFYAYFPSYGEYLSLEHTLADGRRLVYDASYEGSLHGPLMLLPPQAPRQLKPVSRWAFLRRRRPDPKALWLDRSGRRYQGFVVTDRVLLAAGEVPTGDRLRPFLAAVRIEDGSRLWEVKLPAPAVKGGLATGAEGQIFVSLENGRLVAYRAMGG